MSTKRVIPTAFWQEPTVLESYSQADKFFYFYLHTNPLTSQLGIYHLPKRLMAFHTSLKEEKIDHLLKRFSEVHELIEYSHKTQEVALLDSLKFSILKGGKPVENMLQREIFAVQDTDLLVRTSNRMDEFWQYSPRPFDRVVRDLFHREIKRRENSTHTSAFQNENDLQNESDNENINVNRNENENANANADSGEACQTGFSEIEAYLQHEGIIYSREQLLTLQHYQLQLHETLVLEALKRSKDKSRPLVYAQAILKRWQANNVCSLEELKRFDSMNFRLHRVGGVQ